MKRASALLPFIMIFLYMAMGRRCGFAVETMRTGSLIFFVAVIPVVEVLKRTEQLSDISEALLGYITLSALVFWAAPGLAHRYLAAMPVPILYAVVLLMVAVPPLFGRRLFTYHFSRQSASTAFQRTAAFQRLNQQMTGFWITIFTINICVSLVPNIFPLVENQRLYTLFIPMTMLLLVGVPVTRFYPQSQEKKTLRALHPQAYTAAPRDLNESPAQGF